MLSDKEKQELLRLSKSVNMKHDMKQLESARRKREAGLSLDLDQYIRFLTVANAFANHEKKPFKKIEGDHFKL